MNETAVPELEDGTSFTKCMNEDVELGITVLNPDLLGDDLEFTWYINGTEVQSGSSAYYTHTAEQENGMITRLSHIIRNTRVLPIDNLNILCA